MMPAPKKIVSLYPIYKDFLSLDMMDSFDLKKADYSQLLNQAIYTFIWNYSLKLNIRAVDFQFKTKSGERM